MLAKLFGAIKKLLGAITYRLPKKYRFALGAALTLLLIYALSGFMVSTTWNLARGTVDIKVEGRDRLVQDSGSMYEVYTDQGRFINQDSLIRFKRNSGDLQNLLRPGGSYECKTQGYRLKLFKRVPNLVTCKVRDQSYDL